MANRKEVFQEKLMRRLYPMPPKTSQTAFSNSGSVCEKARAKVKRIRGTGIAEEGRKPPLTRVYSVLPPPEGYRAAERESTTTPEPGKVNSEDGPGAEVMEDSISEPSEGGYQRRVRKRRRHGPARGGGEGEGGAEAEALKAQGDPKKSKNRRRKEKKRRHRERLLSLGLAPSIAVAVEFIYQPGLAGEAEADEEKEKECEGEAAGADGLPPGHKGDLPVQPRCVSSGSDSQL